MQLKSYPKQEWYVGKTTEEYLANSGNPVLLSLLHEKSLRNDPSGRSAHTAALRLEILVDPVTAFTKISSAPNTINIEILRPLEQYIANIPSAMLVTAMESADRGIRRLAARTLLERSELSTDRAMLLLTDESFMVRQIALEALIQQGAQLSPDTISQYLKEKPPAEGQRGTLASLASIAGDEAIQTAFALSPEVMGVAIELVNSDEAQFVRAGVGAIWDEEPEIINGILFPLLQHSKTEVRRLPIAYFILRYPKEYLESILREYMGLPTYYYNVICWLDRAFYSPAALASGYRKRFQKEIGDLDS